MRPLRLWPVLLLCAGARAAVPRLCEDRRANDYVLEHFPDSQNPSEEAFLKLSPDQRKAVCAKAALLAKKPAAVAARTPLPHADLGRKIAAALPKFNIDESANLFDHGKAAADGPLIKSPALPVSDAALAVISNEGGAHDAWQLTARAREYFSVTDRTKVRDLVGNVKVDQEHPGLDDRLRNIEHYIVAFDEVQGMARPRSTDGVVMKTAKTVARELAAGLIETPRVIGYSAIKWVDQTVTKPSDYNEYNKPNTSRASWSEVWYGLRGAWSGAFRTDYGNDQDEWGTHDGT